MGQKCFGENWQSCCSGLHQQAGWSSFFRTVEAALCYWGLEHLLFVRALHFPSLENRGLPNIKGQLCPWQVENPPLGGEGGLGMAWLIPPLVERVKLDQSYSRSSWWLWTAASELMLGMQRWHELLCMLGHYTRIHVWLWCMQQLFPCVMKDLATDMSQVKPWWSG